MHKKLLFVVTIAVLTCALVAGCAAKTFKCDWCGKTVEGTPHQVTMLGQNLNICDDCYKEIKEIRDGL